MKYTITLDKTTEIARMDVPWNEAQCIAHILSLVYGKSKLYIHSSMKVSKILARQNLKNYFKHRGINSEKHNCAFITDNDLTEIMYMHTFCPTESLDYHETIIATIRLPLNSIVFEIGGFLLNHLGYDSIDILKDKGVDGRYEQLLELCSYDGKRMDYCIHLGNAEAWSSALSL